jgi:hypothetical protein
VILRLYGLADHYWPHLDAHYYQINLLHLPLHRFLNLVYSWLVERIDPEKRDMWEMMLQEPFEGQEPNQMTDEEEGLAFMNAMAAIR